MSFSHISTLFQTHFRNINPLPLQGVAPNWCVQCSSPAVSSSSDSPPAPQLSPYLGYSLLSVATLVAFRFNSLHLIVILIPFAGQAQHCSIIFLFLCISCSIIALLCFTSSTFIQMRPGNHFDVIDHSHSLAQVWSRLWISFWTSFETQALSTLVRFFNLLGYLEKSGGGVSRPIRGI